MISETYNKWAETYDDGSNPLIPIEEMVVKSLLRTIHFHNVLDAGTGTGRYALTLAANDKQVVAIDSNDAMLKQARDKAKNKNLSIEFRRESIDHISSKNSSFDLVICALALAHIKELKKTCTELTRVLRKGGHLILSDIHPDIQSEWGENHTIILNGDDVAFPAYHSSVSDYIDALTLPNVDVLAAIDVPMQQTQRGLATGVLVMFVRKI